MKSVADVIGVARSNLAERAKHRQPKAIGRPPQPDEDLVGEIKAVIADLPTYGYRRVHAILRRQSTGGRPTVSEGDVDVEVAERVVPELGAQGLSPCVSGSREMP